MILPNSLINGDCLEIMPQIESQSCDLILCDLPYEKTNRNTWDKLIPIEPLWREYKRIIKPKGIIILHAMQPFTSLLVSSNLEDFRYELVWCKPMGTDFLNAKRKFLNAHENILVFYQEAGGTYNPQFTEGKSYKMTRRSDTTNYGEVKELHWTTDNQDGKRYPLSYQYFAADREKLHPTGKPLELAKLLVATFSNENDLVLDNTCGSGTTLVAAKQLNRRYIGIEKDEKFFNIARERLEKETHP